MAFRDLTKALALAAVAPDSRLVDLYRVAADLTALKMGAPHAGTHPLDDEIAFQLGDCADDDHDVPAQRAAGVDVFLEADVLDLETTELVQDFEEVFGLSGVLLSGAGRYFNMLFNGWIWNLPRVASILSAREDVVLHLAPEGFMKSDHRSTWTCARDWA